MGHRYTRTPDHSARQKARTLKNKAKPLKPKKTASEKTKARKLALKEIKRQRFIKSKS